RASRRSSSTTGASSSSACAGGSPRFADAPDAGPRLTLPRDVRRRAAVPGEAIRPVAAHVGHQRRTEARDAGAAGVAYPRIDDAERPAVQQALGQRLRRHVALRIQARLEAGAATQVVEL